MRPARILGLGAQVLGFGNFNIKQLEFPIDNSKYSNGEILGSAGWVLQFTPESLDFLHDFIFNDIEPNIN